MTIKAQIADGVNGGQIEIGTFSLNPAALAANTEVVEDVTIAGLQTDDVVVCMPPSTFEAGLICIGANVTAANTLGVKLLNNTASSVTGDAETWSYFVLKAG